MSYRVWFDGSCAPNPGHGGWGIVVRDDAGKLIHSDNGYLGRTSTSNIAEMTAIIKAMRWLVENPEMRPATIIGDSQLALNMGQGKWKARVQHLVPLRITAMNLFAELDDVAFEWVPRLSNWEADNESTAASSRRT